MLLSERGEKIEFSTIPENMRVGRYLPWNISSYLWNWNPKAHLNFFQFVLSAFSHSMWQMKEFEEFSQQQKEWRKKNTPKQICLHKLNMARNFRHENDVLIMINVRANQHSARSFDEDLESFWKLYKKLSQVIWVFFNWF